MLLDVACFDAATTSPGPRTVALVTLSVAAGFLGVVGMAHIIF
jgi:hypothetical protein